MRGIGTLAVESSSQHCVPHLVKQMISSLSAPASLHLSDRLVLLPFFLSQVPVVFLLLGVILT